MATFPTTPPPRKVDGQKDLTSELKKTLGEEPTELSKTASKVNLIVGEQFENRETGDQAVAQPPIPVEKKPPPPTEHNKSFVGKMLSGFSGKREAAKVTSSGKQQKVTTSQTKKSKPLEVDRRSKEERSMARARKREASEAPKISKSIPAEERQKVQEVIDRKTSHLKTMHKLLVTTEKELASLRYQRKQPMTEEDRQKVESKRQLALNEWKKLDHIYNEHLEKREELASE